MLQICSYPHYLLFVLYKSFTKITNLFNNWEKWKKWNHNTTTCGLTEVVLKQEETFLKISWLSKVSPDVTTPCLPALIWESNDGTHVSSHRWQYDSKKSSPSDQYHTKSLSHVARWFTFWSSVSKQGTHLAHNYQ